MNSVLFYYTLVIMLINVLASAVCISSYFVTQKRSFLYAFIVFIIYFFDVALVFRRDFMFQNLAFSPENFFTITSPVASIITGAGVLIPLWFIVIDMFNIQDKLVKFLPGILYVIASALILFIIKPGNIQEFTFYSMREAFAYFILIFISMHYITTTDEAEIVRLNRSRRRFTVVGLLVTAIVIENIVFQIFYNPLESGITKLPFYAERNFAENITMVYCCYVAFRTSWETLSIRFDKPPIEGASEQLDSSIERILPFYCKRYKLTEREGEILKLIILGYDNQNIASTTSVAISTVKVHVHNILKKTNLSNRRELIQSFWQL